MTTTSLRLAAKGALLDVLGPVLASAGIDGSPVPVSWDKPDDAEVGREHVWLDQLDGELEIAVMNGSLAKSYDDNFTLDLVVQVNTPGQSGREAEERVATIWDLILDALRDPATSGPQLGLASSDGFLWVEVSRLRGPVSRKTTQGRRAVARATLQFHTRIT